MIRRTLTTSFQPLEPVAQDAEHARESAKPSPRHLWALTALTCLSGFLCFNRLDHPPLLIDECFTYWRVCGSLSQLLDTLSNDAFMPLHYELLNWIGQGFPIGFGIHLVPGGILLTPMVLRFIPALCGTAMTPVMYFLARQMFNRRTALIAATFIACSAYGLFFSRNAKMYAPAWMFETLAMACFLWWIRSWKRLAWLCWIFAAIAAAGFQAVTMLVLPLTLIYFVSKGKFSGLRVLMLTVGLALISVGPAIYYTSFNHWTHNSGGLLPGVVGGEPAPDANWVSSGLNWIEPAEDSVRLPLNALNNFLSGFDWTNLNQLAQPFDPVKRISHAMIALAVVTFALFIFGALPWPHLAKARSADNAAEPPWRTLLWLLAWLVLPVYGFFYCRSVENFSSPVIWLTSLYQCAPSYWPAAIAVTIAIEYGLHRMPPAAKFIAIPLLLAALAATVQTARYRLGWMDAAASNSCRLAILAIVPAVLFHYAGENFRCRAITTLQFFAVVTFVWLACGGACLIWRRLHDLSMLRHPELPWQSIWHERYIAIVWPAVWLATAALVSRLPTRTLQVAAVLTICSYNLANSLAREYVQTEIPVDRVMADIYRAQPDSNLRTYFNLDSIFGNIYYRPMVSYNACIVARLHPTPEDFRDGYTWPFQYGPIFQEFQRRCVYTPYTYSAKIRRDMAAHPQVDRVIVWDANPRTFFSFLNRYDPVASGLGDNWKLVADEQIVTHWYWTWRDLWTFRRREFRKTPIVANR